MRWKQFFTPVASIDAPQASKLIEQKGMEGYTLLDVRQPREYEAGHLPGAILIPLAELDKRLEELPQDKPLIIY